MAKKQSFDIGKLLGLRSQDVKSREARRVFTLDDLQQGEFATTGFDPGKGRSTYSRKIVVRFGPSGHILAGPTEHVLGECVVCRDLFLKAGQAEGITVVPRAEGGGGLCAGCQKVYCSGHASVDEENLWWCEECAFDRKRQVIKQAICGCLLKKFTGESDE